MEQIEASTEKLIGAEPILFYKPQEAAAVLRFSMSFMRKLIKSKQIPVLRFGKRKIIISAKVVEDLLAGAALPPSSTEQT